MTMGHLATALVPAARLKDAPVWLLLLCANLPDFAWLLFAMIGLEPTAPESFLDVSIRTMRVEMLYSHGLVWVVALAAVTAGAVFAVWRRADLAAWCGALVVGHLACDYLSGWDHEVAGVGSLKLGFDLYDRAPYVAFAIEAAFAAALVFFFVVQERARGRAIPAGRQAALYAVFAGGSLLFLPNATHSMREIFGL